MAPQKKRKSDGAAPSIASFFRKIQVIEPSPSVTYVGDSASALATGDGQSASEARHPSVGSGEKEAAGASSDVVSALDGGDGVDLAEPSTSKMLSEPSKDDAIIERMEPDIGFYVSSADGTTSIACTRFNFIFYPYPTTPTRSFSSIPIPGLPAKLPITANSRKYLAEHVWRPPLDFTFPRSGPRNLAFQLKWMSIYTWLVYSKAEDGAYCLWCVLFAPSFVGKAGATPTGKLVSCKFNQWKAAKEKFEEHKSREFHESSRIKFNSFLTIEKSGENDRIDVQLDKSIQQEIKENNSILLRMIRAVQFCGEQGLPLRGHRESGAVLVEDDQYFSAPHKDGNFRALLRYACKSGDKVLEQHLQNGPKNAKYTSPQIQNEIISACFTVITSQIVARVHGAKAFSVLADETSDRGGTEQLSLCVRYVHNNRLHEEFLRFIPITDMSGPGLAKSIVTGLTDIGVNVTFMCGQGYDGASAMKGRFGGAQSFVKQLAAAPLALYFHCESHSLNLAISSACENQEIRNCLATVNSIQVFLRPTKREEVLAKYIKEANAGKSRVQGLIPYSPTRFVDRHNSILRFWDQLYSIQAALEEIGGWSDADVARDARTLRKSLLCASFIVALRSVASVFAVCQPLSRQLQAKDMDIMKALTLADLAENTLQAMNVNAEPTFAKIFSEASAVCSKYDEPMCAQSTPRTTGRQMYRSNVPADNPEEYFRRSVFVPFMATVVSEIRERLTAHRTILASFTCILPGDHIMDDSSSITEKCLQEGRIIFQTYETTFLDPHVSVMEFEAELLQWHRFLNTLEEKPSSVMDLYVCCAPVAFPLVSKLLQILATLPVTSCTPERTFNTLKTLKSYLREGMGDPRLNGLTHLYVCEGTCKEEDVLAVMNAEKLRRECNFRIK